MGRRRGDHRCRLALWTLVLLADLVLLLTSAGLSVRAALVAVMAVTAAGVATWRLARQPALARADATPRGTRREA
ncbi:hypothetical protein E1193_10005 [Micromonospora sp. KC606]|uniref:hypothetical protein n=1 Tax=Micromonospora sp. KC606 TaxID=2530379 RepID=UPI001045EB8D|nr:hypothetical protein [Micromonospora sp. KC606]TDC82989.1 hypothetical protein E1193_10005 [Micromonospora sp. KC606]